MRNNNRTHLFEKDRHHHRRAHHHRHQGGGRRRAHNKENSFKTTSQQKRTTTKKRPIQGSRTSNTVCAHAKKNPNVIGMRGTLKRGGLNWLQLKDELAEELGCVAPPTTMLGHCLCRVCVGDPLLLRCWHTHTQTHISQLPLASDARRLSPRKSCLVPPMGARTSRRQCSRVAGGVWLRVGRSRPLRVVVIPAASRGTTRVNSLRLPAWKRFGPLGDRSGGYDWSREERVPTHTHTTNRSSGREFA